MSIVSQKQKKYLKDMSIQKDAPIVKTADAYVTAALKSNKSYRDAEFQTQNISSNKVCQTDNQEEEKT